MHFDEIFHSQLENIGDPDKRHSMLNYYNEVYGYMNSLGEEEIETLKNLKGLLLENSLAAIQKNHPGLNNKFKDVASDTNKMTGLNSLLNFIAASKMMSVEHQNN